MGLITQRSEGGTQIPPGEKLRFRIKSAEEDWGIHGPQAAMVLEVLDGEYKGQTLRDWSKLSQPRLDFVKALRNKDYSDEKIGEILRNEGFEFRSIDDDEEDLRVSNGGKLFNIAIAAFQGDLKAVDAYKTIDDLLEALVGKSFMSITKARGTDGKYTGITWDMIYTDPEASDAEAEEAFDDLPFGDDDPPPAF
jgi:hypothetical protein